MKERPILFSGPMVQAILVGNKTQTRRAIKPQPQAVRDGLYGWKQVAGGGYEVVWNALQMSGSQALSEFCPYGAPGDFLWVRETHVVTAGGNVLYKADDQDLTNCRPSIFMPRWASRITLEIIGVRVQRLQEISQMDSRAEGLDSRDSFALLWDRINEKRGYGWHANPWVWAVEFRVVKA
jgi:hypothetical protein